MFNQRLTAIAPCEAERFDSPPDDEIVSAEILPDRVGRGDYGDDVLRTTLNRVHVGNRIFTVPPLPKGPEGRGGVRYLDRAF